MKRIEVVLGKPWLCIHYYSVKFILTSTDICMIIHTFVCTHVRKQCMSRHQSINRDDGHPGSTQSLPPLAEDLTAPHKLAFPAPLSETPTFSVQSIGQNVW